MKNYKLVIGLTFSVLAGTAWAVSSSSVISANEPNAQVALGELSLSNTVHSARNGIGVANANRMVQNGIGVVNANRVAQNGIGVSGANRVAQNGIGVANAQRTG